MSYFIFPQSWIGPAIAAAAMAFGTLGDTTRVIYRNLDGESIGEARPPRTIVIDKRGVIMWTRDKARCVIIHEYGHLRGFHDDDNTADPSHSTNPRSIMYPVLVPKACHNWLAKHDLTE